VTATTEPGLEPIAGPPAPAVEGQPQEGAQRRRRRRRRRGRGRGQAVTQPGGESGENATAATDEQPTVAPAAGGESPEG
jgi:hypothetical protein